MSAANKMQTAHDRLVALIQSEAKPSLVAPANWPPIINDTDPKKVVPVITEQVGDIESALKAKLQNLGIGIVVMIPMIANRSGVVEIVTPLLRFSVVVTENPNLNKTGKTNLVVIERIFRVVAGQLVYPDSGDEVTVFAVDPTAVEQITPPPNNKDLASVVARAININTEIEIQ